MRSRSNPTGHFFFWRRHRATACLLTALLTVVALPTLGAKSSAAVSQETPLPQDNEKGSLRGSVFDSTRGVIPGVEVTLEHLDSGASQTTITDDSGRYGFKTLDPGPYRLTAELTGFKPFSRKFKLRPGETKVIDPILQVGEITELVSVAATAGPISRSETRVGRELSYPVRSLPLNGRHVYQLARLNTAQEPARAHNTEDYDYIRENGFIHVSDDPLSTFSIDVDTASYSNVRRFLTRQERLPPIDAVRIEELINYFPYHHPGPTGNFPFQVNVETAGTPWQPGHRLVSIGIKGREIDFSARPPANFVFLIDVSGSMRSFDKLPLLKEGLRFMVEQLSDQDRLAIVVYAGASGQVLGSTPGSDKSGILRALDGLRAGGGTNGGEGIQLAYRIASQNFLQDGINRVILATDGDFNVGVTSKGSLVRMIEKEAKKGVFLTVLGFGTGNLKDSKMEKLANQGNGNYAYVDSILEARKVLVDEIGSKLITIAKDVKIQVEFNPLEVARYRLLGYENRLLEHRDFHDDRKDAGEIGAGHSLTILFEVVPARQSLAAKEKGPLRYQRPGDPTPQALSGEMLSLKLRYKEPDSEKSKLITAGIQDDGQGFSEATDDLRFAAAVAAFGMLLRDSEHRGNASFGDVLDWARISLGSDPGGYRREFLDIVQSARELTLQEMAASRR